MRSASSASLCHTISSRMFFGLLFSFVTRSPVGATSSITNSNRPTPSSCLDGPFGGRRRMLTAPSSTPEGALAFARVARRARRASRARRRRARDARRRGGHRARARSLARASGAAAVARAGPRVG